MARLLCRLGAKVAVGSRSHRPRGRAGGDPPRRHGRCRHAVRRVQRSRTREGTRATAPSSSVAGAAGVTLLPASVWRNLPKLKALIDLNAVPPLGIEGVEATDKNAERDHVRAWGALGVGGTKMKIHKKAIQELFTSNDKSPRRRASARAGAFPELKGVRYLFMFTFGQFLFHFSEVRFLTPFIWFLTPFLRASLDLTVSSALLRALDRDGYPASAWRMTPVAGSFQSTRSMRARLRGCRRPR